MYWIFSSSLWKITKDCYAHNGINDWYVTLNEDAMLWTLCFKYTSANTAI